jgi:hypothetical protein
VIGGGVKGWTGQAEIAEERYWQAPSLAEDHSDRSYRLVDLGFPLWVTGGKTPSECMFSESPQIADMVRSAFHHSANPLVLQITAF